MSSRRLPSSSLRSAWMNQMPPPSIRVVAASGARQLLEYLSPLDVDNWPDRKFVFRGQPDADLALEASAHRIRGRIDAATTFGQKAVSASRQVHFEASLLLAFLEGCDRSGLMVAGDRSEIRDSLQTGILGLTNQPQKWPPKDLYQVLAVAQHHGVPTCLLDWTRRAHVAAYFAASSALNRADPPRHVAVWVLDISELQNWRGLDFIQLPGGTSSNLAAQAGVFTVSRITQSALETFDPVPINGHNPYRHGVSLIKYTLPYSEVVPLLEGCHRLGISGSTLFPGFEGVAREVQDLANMSKRDVNWDEITVRDF